MPKPLDTVNWGVIVDSIRNERCILCVGPGLYVEDDEPFEARLAGFLRQHAEKLKIRVYDNGWFHYLEGSNKIEPWTKVKEFYEQPFERAEKIFEELVQIPFHLIISTSPDYKLWQAFKNQDAPVRFESYFMGEAFDPAMIKPSKELPLLYNLLGECEQRRSMVLTYEDFFHYLQSVFAGKSMSPLLRETIQKNTDNFIFVGIPFDRWYVHLFMGILYQHDNKKESLKYAPGFGFDDSIQTYCTDQFNITFVSADMEGFVSTLLEQCHHAGLVRSGKAGSEKRITDEFRAQITKDEMEKVQEGMMEFLNGKGTNFQDLCDEVIKLSGDYSGLMKRDRLGRLLEKEFSVEKARIVDALIQILKIIDERLQE